MLRPIFISICASFLLIITQNSLSAAVGADAYTGKDPIGGGAGYTRYTQQKDYTVSNIQQLKDALLKAKYGDTIYIDDDSEIDATGERNIIIPGGVTLAGNRGKNGSPGPLIKAMKLDLLPDSEEAAKLTGNKASFRWILFQTAGPDVRLTGLRIQGPDTTTRESAYVAPNCDGIMSVYPGLEVDNCEIWGWSHAGIFLSNAGIGASIHHNYIHQCRRNGLGYGVCLASSQADITANHFVDNRHDIAGTGRIGTAYRAFYNISETTKPTTNHAFDMHGNHESRKPDEVVPHFAGDSVVICYNTFRSVEPRVYIRIRGEPRVSLAIHHNVYDNPHIGASIASPCKNGLIYKDIFRKEPRQAYYRFESAGNMLDGKIMQKGDILNY